MRAIQIAAAGGPETLGVVDAPTPEPAAGEVRIEVAAAGINFADILARQGIYPDCPPYPCVVGYDVAGTVNAVGAGVDEAMVGQRVLALTNFGGYAEQACVDARYVWRTPDALDDEHAAAIPLNYITAWALLMAQGGLKSGERVLIHNAGGGVGLASIDIARHAGARVIGTASAGKHDFLRDRGCDVCVDYTTGDWESAVRDATDGAGVDLVTDPIGGPHWKRSVSVLAPTGRLGMFGISAASAPGLRGKLNFLKLLARTSLYHPVQLIRGNFGVFGVNIHAMYGEHARFGAWMRTMLAGVDDGWLRPHVDSRFAFDDAAAAHRHIEARGNIGKVLLVP